jgi:hypothetical protein
MLPAEMEANDGFQTFADELGSPGQPVITADALRVLSAAMGVTGDRDRATYWYRNTPIPEFQHRTAEHLVSAGKTDAVVAYLLSIESGSTG